MLACCRQVRLPGGLAPVYTLSSRWLSLTICKHFMSLRVCVCLSSLFFLIRRASCLDFDVSRTFRSLKFLIHSRDRHKHTSICVFCSQQQTTSRQITNWCHLSLNNSLSFNFYLFVTLKVNDVVRVSSILNLFNFHLRYISCQQICNYKELAMLILFLELSDRIQQERAYHTAAEWFVRLKIGWR